MKKILFSSDILMGENLEAFTKQCKELGVKKDTRHFCSWRDVAQISDGLQFWNGLAVKITNGNSRFAVNSYHKYYGQGGVGGFTIRNRQRIYVGLESVLRNCLAPHIPFQNSESHTFVIYAEDSNTLVVEDRYDICKEVFKIKMLSNRGKNALRNGLRTPFNKKEYFTKMYL